MEGFLVFLGADSPVVIFGKAKGDDHGYDIEWIDGDEQMRAYVPHGQIVAFILGRGPKHAQAALALCGEIEPILLPSREAIDTIADDKPAPAPD